jgi:hypothetical protein
MGFDSAQVGDGNITNVVIKSRYTLLDMKASKAEALLKSMMTWVGQMVVSDINRRHGTAYDPGDIVYSFTRESMVSTSDLAAEDKTRAETDQIRINTILAAAPRLDDESVLRLLCDQFGLDWEEVSQRIEEQSYEPGPFEGTDPESVEDMEAVT